MADTALRDKISKFVDSNREAIVQDLQEILRFRTVGGGETDAEKKNFQSAIAGCLAAIEKQAHRMGLGFRNADNLYAVAELTGGQSHIALPVHVDVVPPGTGWQHDPFSGEIVGDEIWGRGCQDDKGPVTQMLWAMHTMKQLGRKVTRGARMVIGTGEEGSDWADVHAYLQKESPAEMSIVPDASFPIINGEKGMLNMRLEGQFEEDAEASVGGYRFVSAHAGERPNIVPDDARLCFHGDSEADAESIQKELERFLRNHPDANATLSKKGQEIQIAFRGKAAHGSTPTEGHNAAVDLLLFMTESGYVSDDEADVAQFLYECGADFSGKPLGIATQHHFVGPTTVNLGVLRWDGGNVHAMLNIRNTLGLPTQHAIQRVQAAVAEFKDFTGFEITANSHGKTMEPIYVDPDQNLGFINTLKEAYTVVTGREAKLGAIGGTTYAKVFPRAVCFGPVDNAVEEELAHKADERITVDQLLRNVKIYAYALAQLCTE